MLRGSLIVKRLQTLLSSIESRAMAMDSLAIIELRHMPNSEFCLLDVLVAAAAFINPIFSALVPE